MLHFEMQTMKPFTVYEMTFKDHSIAVNIVIDFSSETGKVDYT